jgi:orotidine-5'-phosphate decarboxylase
MTFQDKLVNAAQRNHSLLCVGLDPDPNRLRDTDIAGFLFSIVEATKDLVCAYKPNLAFYEQLGEKGYPTLKAVIDAVPDNIPVIADAKRGDVGHTAEAYATSIFDKLGCDAATVNPYLGHDTVEPFLRRPDRTAIIVCRTSNPGAGDFQDLSVGENGQPLYEVVAERARAWNARGNVGLVAGATYPSEIARLREICPEMPLLIPGVGAQRGDLATAVRAGLDSQGAGIIVNASRQVLYDGGGPRTPEAARDLADRLRDEMEQQRLVELQEIQT